MTIFGDHGRELDELLGLSIRSLDITRAEYETAVARYTAVGKHLADYWEDTPVDGLIYPQGSMRLGTITRNIHRNDEIDIDLVARRNIAKTAITQAELKDDAGHALAAFVGAGPEGTPVLDEPGKRCWTLLYPGFHLDVLPAIPDASPEQQDPNAILVTDTELRRWQFSNPIGYADWFLDRARQSTQVEMRASIEVDPVPEWLIKTVLQETVQALKRHRDIYFTGRLDVRPASVIVTTLAAHAFRPGGALYEVLRDITKRMADYVETEKGIFVIRNPVNAGENFADRWKRHPERGTAFFEWIEQAAEDFAALGDDRGPRVLTRLSEAFGQKAARAAATARGTGLFQARTTQRLGVKTRALTTGAITIDHGLRIPGHDFHGPSPR